MKKEKSNIDPEEIYTAEEMKSFPPHPDFNGTKKDWKQAVQLVSLNGCMEVDLDDILKHNKENPPLTACEKKQEEEKINVIVDAIKNGEMSFMNAVSKILK